MQRRKFLSLVLALPLAGCGGVSLSDSANLTGRALAGRVVLPVGSPLELTSLVLESALADSPLRTDGSFQAQVPSGASGSTLVWLRNETGVLLMGFIDEINNTIDTHSSAVALLYLTLGGYMANTASKPVLLNALRANPIVSTLAQVFATRFAANPTALPDGDPTLAAAIQTAHAAILTELGAPSRSAHALTRARQAEPAPDLLLAPTTTQSKFRIDQGSAAQTILATNEARRYTQVMTYEVDREDQNGQRANPARAKLVSSVWVPSTPALGLLSTGTGFFSQNTAFTPVISDPIALAMNAGDAKTFFETIVLGSSSLVSDPPVYGEARYAEEVGTWREIRAELNLTSWVGDVLFGLLLELWGLRDVTPNNEAIKAAAKDFRVNYYSIYTELFAYAEAGNYAGATRVCLQLMATNLEFVEHLLALVIAISPSLRNLLTSSASILKTGSKLLIRSLLAAINVAGLVLGAGDLGAVLADLASSEPTERWQETLINRKTSVKLAPTSSTIAPGDSLSLAATLSGSYQGRLRYVWSLSGGVGLESIGDGNGNVGNQFESEQGTVLLVTTPSSKGTVTIGVQAVSISPSGERTTLGTASSTVNINDDVPFGSVRVVFDGKTRILPRLNVQKLSGTTGLALGATYQRVSTEYGGLVGLKLILQFSTPTVTVGSTARVVDDYDLTYELPNGGSSLYFAPSAPGTLTVTEVGQGYFGYTLSVNLKGLRGVPTTGPATFKGWVTNY